MKKIAIYRAGHVLYESEGRAGLVFEGAVLKVNSSGAFGPETLYVYVLRRGEQAQVQILDHVETVTIGFPPATEA